jgi:hypothetical protein
MPDQSNNRKQKRKPRQPVLKREPTDWRSNIHPFFIRLAEQHKKIVQLSRSGSEEDRRESQRLIRNPPPELVEEAQRVGDEFRRSGKKLDRSISAIYTIDERFPATPDISDEDYMLAWFAWNRYGKTFKQLLEEDRSGVRQSSMRVLAVGRDYQRWRYRETDPENIAFKMDREHQVLIQYGLSFGIESISAEELADCFNELCPCGKTHFPENLRKLRARVVEFLDAARDRASGIF